MTIGLPPLDDPYDAVFQIAHKGLGAVVDQGIEDLQSGWKPGYEPPRHERFAFLVLTHALQEIGNVFHSLKPTDRTLAYGTLGSDALRTLCDMFARQLAVWSADLPADALAGDIAEGLRQELHALDAASRAGVGVDEERATLESVAAQMKRPHPVKVANVLEQQREWEALCVYRWESSHAHFGHGAASASGRSIKQAGGAVADVVMYPMSLWRAGQILWATYGVGLRVLTLLGAKLSISFPGLRGLDIDLRGAIRQAALREKRRDEPVSPPYGRFAFPLWNEPDLRS